MDYDIPNTTLFALVKDMIKKYRNLPFVFLFALYFLSCQEETIETIPVSGGPEIIYWMTGGIAGITDTVIFVDSNGVATSRSGYPKVQRALTHHEYQSIISLFDGFDAFSDSFFPIHSVCADEFIHHLVLRKESSPKKVWIDGCALDEDSVIPDVARLGNILRVLRNLSDTIYKEDNPWKGVTVRYTTNKSVYLLNEPIQLHILIVNPTDVVRTLYFRTEQKFTFNVRSTTPPELYFRYPSLDMVDTTKPSQIVLPPKTQYEIQHKWEYAVDTSLTLTHGKYNMYIHLLARRFRTEFQQREPIMFEITE
ncbi:MAG: hypothetical protein HYZ34_04240 [Ignavibacteriae bacterium]|nr:hypothetical protein [Ignavibacteriota bacterium]